MRTYLTNVYLIYNAHTNTFLKCTSYAGIVTDFTHGNTNKYTVYYNDNNGVSHPCWFEVKADCIIVGHN